MTVHDHIARARRQLVEAGVPDGTAGLEAELLARHLLGWDRSALIVNRRSAAPPVFAARYGELVARRARREPIAFITGTREFWGLDLEVTDAVLIPRPETELIVEEALRIFGAGPTPRRILDVGTGSGCLAIALAREFPTAAVLATDISAAALQVARRNAARHGVTARVRFVRTDLLAGLRPEADLIVSNPPYVPDLAAPALSPDVRDFEPAVALLGGPDGLDIWRALLADAARCLRRNGWLVAEFGFGQEETIRDLIASAAGWELQRTVPDLQGIARTAAIRRL